MPALIALFANLLIVSITEINNRGDNRSAWHNLLEPEKNPGASPLINTV